MAESSATTVLVVDDDQDLADLYTEYLSTAGYDVRTAYNGGEAILELDEAVDVVLLDRDMPGMSGDEVLAEIRDWLDWCRVVLVTGVDPDFEVATLPFDEYMTKPVERAQILATVEKMLLLDEYDELLNEYLSVTKRYATLKSNKPRAELDESERFGELVDERKALRDRIATVIAEFSDSEFATAFEELHNITPAEND